MRFATWTICALAGGLFIGCGGGQDAPVQPSGSPTPSDATTIPVLTSPTLLGASPVEAVRSFYEAIAVSDLDRAYATLSQASQATQSFITWADGYTTTIGIQMLDLRQESDDEVFVRVRAIDALEEETLIRIFEGNWQVVVEGGEWKLESGDLQEAERQVLQPLAPLSGSGTGLWEFAPEPPSAGLQGLVDAQCEGSGQEGRAALDALETISAQQLDIWEYWKAASLQNLANLQWFEACGAFSPPANFGFILPLPAAALIEQIRTDTFRSDDCEDLAFQIVDVYRDIAQNPSKGYVYFEVQPDLDPLEERWRVECSG